MIRRISGLHNDAAQRALNPQAPEAPSLEAYWLEAGDWRSFEHYVAAFLTAHYRGIAFELDVKIRGAKSGTLRQIDILADAATPTAIECKHVSRRVDVKCVESFLGMLDDVGLRAGILISSKGFSRAALERATNDPRQIDLAMLLPERLSDYQFAVPPLLWTNDLAVWLDLPTGWILDIEKSADVGAPAAYFYPLGHTRDSAQSVGEICYANFLTPLPGSDRLAATAAPHEAILRSDDPDVGVSVDRLELADGDGKRRPALLRVTRSGDGLGRTEHALYVDYGSAILLLVMLSAPRQAMRKAADLLVFYEKSITLAVVGGDRPKNQ